MGDMKQEDAVGSSVSSVAGANSTVLSHTSIISSSTSSLPVDNSTTKTTTSPATRSPVTSLPKATASPSSPSLSKNSTTTVTTTAATRTSSAAVVVAAAATGLSATRAGESKTSTQKSSPLATGDARTTTAWGRRFSNPLSVAPFKPRNSLPSLSEQLKNQPTAAAAAINNQTSVRSALSLRKGSDASSGGATDSSLDDEVVLEAMKPSLTTIMTTARSHDDLEDEGCSSMGLSSGCESSIASDLDEEDDEDVEASDSETDSKGSNDSGTDNSPSLSSTPNSVVINGKTMDISSERYAVLSYDQVMRLDSVMDESMPIHGRGNFPTLEIKLKDLVQVVRSKLQDEGVTVRDIRLNGGAASYVLSSENPRHYTDLDLIFDVDLEDASNFERVRSAVLDSLLDFLPEGVITKRMSSCTLQEAYVHKMVKVTEGGDRWSLISLCNHTGRDVELKFVDRMRRQFEFSVDSFQIILDSLLLFYECSGPSGLTGMTMSANFYPTVVGESVYGNFSEALSHLQRKIVATRNPEEIRGGGLLKYCRLLVQGYKAVKYDEIKNLERYMCSRFFIDFSELGVQRLKLESYLMTHFQGDDQTKYDYLTILHRVVDESTVCLMGHERRQTLNLIEELAYQSYYLDQQRQLAKHQQQQQHHHHQHQQQSHHHQQQQQQYGPTYVQLGAGQHIYYTTASPYHPHSFHHVNCYNCHCGGWMACV